MNMIELDRALRQLRLSGMADVLETRCSRHKPMPWLPSTCSPAWSPMNSPAAASACWSAATSRRSSATRTSTWIISISNSIRK
jgi:hypothetical protein